MSLSHAFKFYNLFKQDPNFRKACYACKSREEWFVFSDSEFEEVISSTLFRCLMEAIETIAKERQCSRITLEVREDNMVAQHLYEKMGFGETAPPMLYWRKYLE